MLCQFERLIYPQNINAILPSSYMVAAYRPCERILDSSGHRITSFKAVGYCLPTSERIRYEMQGHWSKNSKHGMQYEVETYKEVIIPTRDGIIAYLASGQIRGIGPALAERIYNRFAEDSLEVLDKEPDKLLLVPGISKAKLKKIKESYLANRGARDVVAFLAPHGITAKRAVQFYREFGNNAIEIVRNNPYSLCELPGIGFTTADKIAINMGFSKLCDKRIDQGLLFTLVNAENKGNLCMEKHAFIDACLSLLDTPELTENAAADRAMQLVYDGRLVCYGNYVYRDKTAKAEVQLASNIARQLEQRFFNNIKDFDLELDREEQTLNIRLAPEQRDAVKMALKNNLSIITGGPGTGKTLIQRVLLNVYKHNFPNNQILCCAPTGRAARRMSQSTGCTAVTVHKALGLLAGDDGFYNKDFKLDEDLIIVDEVSMLDIYLADLLFKALKPGAQLVLIGDADQLPSVGPGAVLSEMISSKCIPLVVLDKVFRQNSGSRIAINAKLIRHGNVSLEYGDDFKFIESPDTENSAEIISETYMQEVAKYGIDNVALLTPFRQKTETGANALNMRIRDLINPAGATKNEIKDGKREFRSGDKIMQIRNHEDINNGDIGYITNIFKSSGDTIVNIDFGDGRTKEYDENDLELLDLGYASTVHKSQGSEYSSVIINLQCAHSVMLTRPLIYTAITRSKERVVIVGERRALCTSIKRLDTEKRGTCLAQRIVEKYLK